MTTCCTDAVLIIAQAHRRICLDINSQTALAHQTGPKQKERETQTIKLIQQSGE